jgi:hypothetical protein
MISKGQGNYEALLLTREFNKMVDKIIELTSGEIHSPRSSDKPCVQTD